MTEQLNIDVSQIKLLSIKLLRGNIENGLGLDEKPKSYRYTFNISTQIEQVKKLIRYEIQVVISNKENSAPLASYVTEFILSIGDLFSYISFDEEKHFAVIEPAIGITLVSICYSTLRGVIFTRTQGTVLNGIILPVVDPVKLLNSSPILEFQSS